MAHAGGKVILVGEHAVVYGVEALVAGLKRGVRASVTAGTAGLILNGSNQAAGSANAQAYASLCAALGVEARAVDVSIDMPVGVGLGASAAMGVALARALYEARGETPENAKLLQAVAAWERVFHGNPSGIDAAAAAYGGCIAFSRGHGVRPVALQAPLTLAVAVAGPASATHEMVARVAERRRADPNGFDSFLAHIAELSRQAERCLASGAVVELGAVLDENHARLVELQLSTPEIERARLVAKRAGALGAKVTGAGGGGCVLALAASATETAAPLLQAWRELGIQCFETRIGEAVGC